MEASPALGSQSLAQQSNQSSPLSTRLGLNLVATDHAVEAGIQAISQRLSSGRLKVFRTLSAWRSEFRTYRRDDKGQAVENALLMDCTRHLVLTGMKHADIDHDPYDEIEHAAARLRWRRPNVTGS